MGRSRSAVESGWIKPEEFTYSVHDELAMLRLLGVMRTTDARLGRLQLVVARGLERRLHRSAAVMPEPTSRALARRELVRWRAHYMLPLEVVEDPEATFQLISPRGEAILLPVPEGTDLPAQLELPGRTYLRQVRRHALALTGGFAAAAALSAGGVAVASTTASTTGTAGTSTDASAAVTTTTTGTTTDEDDPAPDADDTATNGTTTDTDTPVTTTNASSTAAPPSSTAAATPPPAAPTSTAAFTVAAPVTSTTTTAATPATTTPSSSLPSPTQPAGVTPTASSHKKTSSSTTSPRRTKHPVHKRHHRTAKPKRSTRTKHHRTRHHARHAHHVAKHPANSAPSVPLELSGSALSLLGSDFGVSPFTQLQIADYESVGNDVVQPPHFLVKIFKAAGHRYHVPWQILAAINSVETNYGRNLNVSPAGAIGWMQFEPGTWLKYGVRVHGQGPANPYDPTDAIYSAARYLRASGAPRHLRKAIFAYNHALWYVDVVLWRAQMITDHSLHLRLRHHGYALPLDRRYMKQLGRTDDGVDIEDAPDGTAVYSITPGVVTAVASDPTGFGPNYPVIQVTKGPLAGQFLYYGHVAASLVKPGMKVLAGQPIAIMGHTGDAASLGHGHIEIGFSDASGDPLNHHEGLSAWTPSGDAMRGVILALSHAYRVHTD